MEERYCYLGFSLCPGIGPKRVAMLLQSFGTAKAIWTAQKTDVQNIIGTSLAEKFDSFRKSFLPEKYEMALSKKGVTFVSCVDATYPSLLQEIINPPLVLYVKGNQKVLTTPGKENIGIVGTRKITSYGRNVTEMLTKDLVNAGCIIVSGLAMGVDAVAHKMTVDMQGQTIAVLGCGVDCCTPAMNQHLYNSILASGGVVVSEYPLGQVPTKGSFPARNRIIAGLSDAIVVTEGAKDSGALITADEAFKNKRKVFAVPGPITSSLSKGPNNLLSKGAFLVSTSDDILKELHLKPAVNKRITFKSESAEEQKIIDLLQNESLHINDMVKQLGIPVTQLTTLLSLMEMKGLLIVSSATNEYSLNISL